MKVKKRLRSLGKSRATGRIVCKKEAGGGEILEGMRILRLVRSKGEHYRLVDIRPPNDNLDLCETAMRRQSSTSGGFVVKRVALFLLLLGVFSSQRLSAAESANAIPRQIRVGVDIRMGYQSCLDSWIPVGDYFSRAIPEYRFTIVPIASQEDLISVIEKGGVDFLSLDPAMELVVEDRFGVVPLATLVESITGQPLLHTPEAASYGAIIRLTERKEIKTIRDLRGLRVAAVKPWSLTGWIAPWGLLLDHGIKPEKDLQQVAFLGTHGQVVKSVLEGTADVGVLDADMLYFLGKYQRIPQNVLSVFDREGNAVPLTAGTFQASTKAYPGRFFSKMPSVSDELAKRMINVLVQKTVNTYFDGMPCSITCSVPSNTSKVRRLLERLMGPQFESSPGYPLPYVYPAWIYPASAIGGISLIAAIFILIIRHRYVHRTNLMEQLLAETRDELDEVRAESQRVNAILAMAGCGIDIVDSEHRIVYADPGLERKYGDWRGRKCHEYFCHSDTPCVGCKLPNPQEETLPTTIDLDGSAWSCGDDPHARLHCIEGETTRMIGIPFRDEGGRWMYARLHFPIAAFAEKAPT